MCANDGIQSNSRFDLHTKSRLLRTPHDLSCVQQIKDTTTLVRVTGTKGRMVLLISVTGQLSWIPRDFLMPDELTALAEFEALSLYDEHGNLIKPYTPALPRTNQRGHCDQR